MNISKYSRITIACICIVVWGYGLSSVVEMSSYMFSDSPRFELAFHVAYFVLLCLLLWIVIPIKTNSMRSHKRDSLPDFDDMKGAEIIEILKIMGIEVSVVGIAGVKSSHDDVVRLIIKCCRQNPKTHIVRVELRVVDSSAGR